MMVGVDTKDAEEALSATAGRSPAGGLFLLPGHDALLLGDALNSIKTAALVEPLVAIDDEGGRVQTLENLSGALPSAREQVSTMRPDNVRDLLCCAAGS